jgi:GTP cyclohydrolase IA
MAISNYGASDESMAKINNALYPKEYRDPIDPMADISLESGIPLQVSPALRRAHTTGEEVVRALLGGIIGEDVDREGLLETPARVVKAWKHWCGGYKINVQELIKTFADGAEGADEMVVRKNIRIYSHCEHHLAPIIGDCTIAYIPSGRVIGLSKLDRVADAFARRLQVQERLTSQIADALWEGLQPLGVGVHINARHMCVESRGVMQHNSDTMTTALRGVLKTAPEARAEFMALVAR